MGTVLRHRYLIRSVLGAGVMGTTFLAQDLLWNRPVSLKLLRRASASNLERLRHEFLHLPGLVHPHLVQVLDLELHDPAESAGWVFFTARFVDGVPLDQYAAGTEWVNLTRTVGDVLSALGFLHSRGIHHGDIKPANVLVDAFGRATLIDLGPALNLGEVFDRGLRHPEGAQ